MHICQNCITWDFTWRIRDRVLPKIVPLEFSVKSWRVRLTTMISRVFIRCWKGWFSQLKNTMDEYLSLTLLASLNPQIIRRAVSTQTSDTWQLIKTWAQIFSDQEMDERNNAARRGIPKITFFLNNISKWHGQKSSQIYDVVESSYHKKPFFNKVISLALWKNHLKTTPDTFLLLVPQCLKITQKGLVLQNCERSEQLIYHCHWL